MQPILYSIIEKRKLRELLETFYQCINLPIQVLDETGKFWILLAIVIITVKSSSIFFQKENPAPNFTQTPASLL